MEKILDRNVIIRKDIAKSFWRQACNAKSKSECAEILEEQPH
jgi:hypothetical protein